MPSDSYADDNPAAGGKTAETFDIDIYRALVEHMLNGVAYCRMLYRDGRPYDFIYLYTNPAFERLTGLGQVAGKPVSEVIPGICEADPQLFDIYSRVAMGAAAERFETYVESLAMWFWISVYSPKPEHFVAIFDVITERKQTELALIDADKRWSLAQRAAVAGAWYWDIGTNAIYWSDEFYELFGLEPQKKTASFETWRELLHDEDRQQAERKIEQAIADHLPLAIEYRIVTPAGEERWIRALGDTAYDERGAARRMTGICIDITQSKRAEMALRESEERLRLAQASANIGIWDWDIAHNHVSFNSEYYKLLGLPEGVPHGYEDFLAMLHAEDRPRLEAMVQQALAEVREDFNIEYRLIRGDGATRWLASKGRFIVEDGQPRRSLGIVLDITERKLAEEELKLASMVYQNSSEAMMVTDADNRIVTVNPAFSKMTGYAPPDVLGKNPRLLSSGRHDSAFYRSMWRAISTNGCWQGEIWNRHKNGAIYPEFLSISVLRDRNGEISHYIGLSSDISERKKSEEEIWRQANFDTLTGLPNRRMFHNCLEQEIRKASRLGATLALLFLDIDYFKEVNDTMGHSLGDVLLQEAGRRLTTCVRNTDTVARLGGDEFTIILVDLDDTRTIDVIAQSILTRLAEPFAIGEELAYVSASVGITLYPDDGSDPEQLIKNADHAMYAAKSGGRNRYSYFTSAMQEVAQNRMRLTNDLRNALVRRQFQVYYQPIVELASGRIEKAEALIRWLHPIKGLISPAAFIPLAEETGMIVEIGDWVFRQAVEQVRYWRGLYRPNFQISVNKSPVQFRTGGDPNASWLGQLRSSGLPGQSIVVEITEGILMDSHDLAYRKLLEFRDSGIQVAIDDFGTGYSSLSYLKKFDIDYLKIDQSFTRNLTPVSDDMALCEAIVVMAHKLGLKVIAEGVETQQQLDLLKNIGCDYGQGYLFSKPVPSEAFEVLLAAQQKQADQRESGSNPY